MSYFSQIPSIQYQFPDNVVRQYSNLSFRPAIIDRVINSASNFMRYTIQDGDTPDTIAYDYYGDSQLHWVVLTTNNIVDYYTQWPKTRSSLDRYITQKYRSVMDSDGNMVTLTDAQLDEYVNFVGTATNSWTATIDIKDSDRGPVKSVVRLRPQYFEDVEGRQYSYDLIVNNIEPKTAWGTTIQDFPVNPAPISLWRVEDNANTRLRGIRLLKQNVVAEIQYELRDLANGR